MTAHDLNGRVVQLIASFYLFDFLRPGLRRPMPAPDEIERYAVPLTQKALRLLLGKPDGDMWTKSEKRALPRNPNRHAAIYQAVASELGLSAPEVQSMVEYLGGAKTLMTETLTVSTFDRRLDTMARKGLFRRTADGRYMLGGGPVDRADLQARFQRPWRYLESGQRNESREKMGPEAGGYLTHPPVSFGMETNLTSEQRNLLQSLSRLLVDVADAAFFVMAKGDRAIYEKQRAAIALVAGPGPLMEALGGIEKSPEGIARAKGWPPDHKTIEKRIRGKLAALGDSGLVAFSLWSAARRRIADQPDADDS